MAKKIKNSTFQVFSVAKATLNNCIDSNGPSIIVDSGHHVAEALYEMKKQKLQGTNICVEDTARPGGFNGDDPCNIVNRLGIKGIQIEQCKKARRDHHDKIAQAVVDVIGSRINV